MRRQAHFPPGQCRWWFVVLEGILLHVGFIFAPFHPQPYRVQAHNFPLSDTHIHWNPPRAPCPLSHCDWREERDMLIKRNEIDICINRSENTKGVHSFQIPRFEALRAQKKFILRSQWLSEPCTSPHSHKPPPTHWSLLYVIEIETSIRTCLPLGTKESDIHQ